MLVDVKVRKIVTLEHVGKNCYSAHKTMKPGIIKTKNGPCIIERKTRLAGPFVLLLAGLIIVATVLLLTGCVRLNTAGVIDNIGREYKAVLVEKAPESGVLSPPGIAGEEDKPMWEACEADGNLYIKADMAIVRERNVWIKDAAFSQLPHKNFYFDVAPSETCYYHRGKIYTEKPASAVDTTTEPKSVYPFYSVYSSAQLKHPQRYEPLWLEEQHNPHRIYTVPLSWIAAVLVDIPGGVVCSAVALPGEIYSVLFD